MLHASAVTMNGRAVIFIAGPRGGKSTLAHRACAERGAHFLADDLVFVGPDRTVVGWPTRIALPAELGVGGVGRLRRTVADKVSRTRVILSPPEHRAVLGLAYSPPVPLGSVIVIEPDRSDHESVVWAAPLASSVLSLAMDRAARVPAQRLHVSDPLGLVGGPRTAFTGGVGGLDGVSAVALRIPDMATLHDAPVWEALAGQLPILAAS